MSYEVNTGGPELPRFATRTEAEAYLATLSCTIPSMDILERDGEPNAKFESGGLVWMIAGGLSAQGGAAPE